MNACWQPRSRGPGAGRQSRIRHTFRYVSGVVFSLEIQPVWLHFSYNVRFLHPVVIG
jgi:hypothetical protein